MKIKQETVINIRISAKKKKRKEKEKKNSKELLVRGSTENTKKIKLS